MKNLYLLAASGLVLASCEQEAPTNLETDSKTEVVSNQVSQQITTNYAVIWSWKTDDAQLVEENLPNISSELTKMWKNNVVENAYFNTGDNDKVGDFPNVAFFLKATSTANAKSILNELIVVEKNIATYDVYPVGDLWLGKKEGVNYTLPGSKTFVTVWSTLAKKPTDELVLAQNDSIMELWNSGKIENVYFDIKGTQNSNSVTDFVFFINAKSENEARNLCNALPFTKEGVASYALFPSGVFWMGKNQ